MATQRIIGAEPVEGGLEALSELRAASIGTASKIRLFQSSFVPTLTSVEADFEAAEATFTDYASVANTWAPPGLDPSDGPTMYGTRALFVATDAVAPNNIGGAWISVQTSAGPPPVNKSVQYCVFPVPVDMTTALAQLNVQPVMKSPDLAGYFVIDY